MVTIHKLNEYEIKEGDKFFFDANIWMYMYCSIGEYGKNIVRDYSDFYQKVKQSGSPILTTPLLISEIINRYSKMEFDLVKKKDGLSQYKRDFRSNPEYKPTLDHINLVTERKILGNSLKVHDRFNEFEESVFFSNPNTYDFNDEYYSFLAEKMNFKIVTNDRDFKKSFHEIEIITRLK